jgi:hypothetical protein
MRQGVIQRGQQVLRPQAALRRSPALCLPPRVLVPSAAAPRVQLSMRLLVVIVVLRLCANFMSLWVVHNT